MNVFHNLVNAILVMLCLYGLALWLRKKGTLVEAHSLTFARVVTDLCLPAIIFISLAQTTIQWRQIKPALVMLMLELLCIAIAWGIARLLKFNRPQQGAIVFCSAFGSSTFLGYALIMQMFPDSREALGEAVLISEIGVGYPIFILGPILGAYFGSDASTNKRDMWRPSLSFFKSPVCFALLIGLLWGHFQLPGKDNLFVAPLFQLGNILASALTPLAMISVGLMFKPIQLKRILIPLAIVVLLKLITKPLLAHAIATQIDFPELWQEVLVLLAAMPPAVLGAVFLRRYGGDASLASALLLAASLISSLTLLGVFWIIL